MQWKLWRTQCIGGLKLFTLINFVHLLFLEKRTLTHHLCELGKLQTHHSTNPKKFSEFENSRKTLKTFARSMQFHRQKLSAPYSKTHSSCSTDMRVNIQQVKDILSVSKMSESLNSKLPYQRRHCKVHYSINKKSHAHMIKVCTIKMNAYVSKLWK